MYYVTQEEFSPGMVVGQQIYVIKNDRALLQGGVGLKLTSSMIDSLKRSKVEKLLIQDSFSEGIQCDCILSASMENSLRVEMRKILDNINPKRLQRPSPSFMNLIGEIISDISPSLVTPLSRNYDEENFLLEHSINVGLISIALGKSCGIMGTKLRELAAGAFFHDIGLTQMSSHLYLTTPEDPGDKEKYRKHTLIGWKLLKDSLGFKNLTPYIALRHHELLDRTGFPSGGELASEIHPVSRIVGIVDAYDRATCWLFGQEPQNRTRFVEDVLGNSKKYDSSILRNFCNIFTFYPTCSIIKLSNEQKGIVIGQNSDKLRPVVQMQDGNNNSMVIDLSRPEHSSLKITYCNC